MPHIRKLDNEGFSHHFLLPLLVIMLIAAAGTYVLQKSRAGVSYTNGPVYTGNSFVRPDGSKEDNISYSNLGNPQDGWVSDLVFGPDGGRIAYVQSEISEGSSVLRTAKSDGTDIKELYRFEGETSEAGKSISRPTWSSDGKYIAFFYGDRGEYISGNGSGTLTVIRADGNRTDSDANRTIPAFTGDGSNFGFSNSGIQFVPGTQKIVFLVTVYIGDRGTPTPHLCTIDIATDNEPLCNTITGLGESSPYPSDLRVSNKGVGLFVTKVWREGTADEWDVQVNKLNLSTSRAQRLGASRHVVGYYAGSGIEWSPDGRQIAYQEISPPTNDPSLRGTFVMDEYGQNSKKISNRAGSGDMAWQPIPVGGSQSPLPTTQQSVSCIIEGPVGGHFTANQSNQVRITLTNHSVGNISTNVTGSYYIAHGTSPQQQDLPAVPASIPADGAVQILLPAFLVPYAEYEGDAVNVRVELGTGGLCWTGLGLPNPPLTLGGRLDRTVPYSRNFTFSGRTLPSKSLSLLNVSTDTTKDATESDQYGKFSLSTSTNRELTNYNVVLQGGFKTPNVAVKTRAVVNGKIVSYVEKGQQARITGKYIPNKTLTMFVRKPSDEPGKFPTKITLRTDANGNFSRSISVNKRADYYIQTPNGAVTPTYTIKVQ